MPMGHKEMIDKKNQIIADKATKHAKLICPSGSFNFSYFSSEVYWFITLYGFV